MYGFSWVSYIQSHRKWWTYFQS